MSAFPFSRPNHRSQPQRSSEISGYTHEHTMILVFVQRDVGAVSFVGISHVWRKAAEFQGTIHYLAAQTERAVLSSRPEKRVFGAVAVRLSEGGERDENSFFERPLTAPICAIIAVENRSIHQRVPPKPPSRLTFGASSRSTPAISSWAGPKKPPSIRPPESEKELPVTSMA